MVVVDVLWLSEAQMMVHRCRSAAMNLMYLVYKQYMNIKKSDCIKPLHCHSKEDDLP